MWGTIVNRDGVVCAVAFTGGDRGDEWPGSRVISAQKANTANSFSLPGLALSSANLWAAVQPGGSLFGLQESNPVDTGAAYKGPSAKFGTGNDPLVGVKIGGINVFGGGLALYNKDHVLVGGVGVSGDTSCADHNIAWRTRHNLNLDFVPNGVFVSTAARPDNINYQGLVPVNSSAERLLAPDLQDRRRRRRVGDQRRASGHAVSRSQGSRVTHVARSLISNLISRPEPYNLRIGMALDRGARLA